MMNAYFVIMDKAGEQPLFEAEFFRPDFLTKLENEKGLHHFIAHAALDMVESLMWTINSFYLKVVDRYGDWFVSALLASTGERLLLLHDHKNDDGIKNFLLDASDLYTRYTLNPFYATGTPIKPGPFEVKIRLLAKKYLEK